VPYIYRLAASRRGVFVNPALTEPFGLTLLEAAASGLPVVATQDGGPQNIIGACKNGALVDPLDTEAIGRAILGIVTDRRRWRRLSRNGITGVHEHFSWRSHARRYVTELKNILKGQRLIPQVLVQPRSRLPMIDRILATDIDNVLSGDREARRALLDRLGETGDNVGFAVSTGRGRESALKKLKELEVPKPNILIACVGTEIYYGPRMVADRVWERQIDYRWQPERVREVLDEIPGLHVQPPEEQHRFKVSYDVDTKKAPRIRLIVRRLRQAGLAVQPVFSHGAFLDILPVRVTPGAAIRHLGFKWDIPPNRLLVVGFSGNDEKMLRGDTLGVVIANCSKELNRLRGHPRIHFAEGEHAWGILEGIDYYDFFGAIRVPEVDDAVSEAELLASDAAFREDEFREEESASPEGESETVVDINEA
jgi:sucrose-phosphate synthase